MAANRKSAKRRWPLVCAVVTALLGMVLAYPQPELDIDFVSKLAVDRVGTDLQSSSDSAHLKKGLIPLDGVVIAITGATSGIGHGLATTLHNLGATIVAVGRSPSKLSRLQKDLDGNISGEHQRVITFVADLTDLESVAKAADRIISQFTHLDYLCNNAGIHYGGKMFTFWSNYSTPQGYDKAFVVNYLSHFLLTEKLLPLLKASRIESPRIIQMSSSFHWLSDGSDVVPRGVFSPLASQSDVKTFFHRERSYSNSKLAQIMHARSLSKELRESKSGVKVVSVCPGWVGTSISGGGINQFILQNVAYPNEGFGLASTLCAMFLPDAGNEGKDWIVNSGVFEVMGNLMTRLGMIGREWPARSGFRDLLSWIFAVSLLYTQKFFSGVQYTASSPESYADPANAALFQWSHDAVSKWLV